MNINDLKAKDDKEPLIKVASGGLEVGKTSPAYIAGIYNVGSHTTEWKGVKKAPSPLLILSVGLVSDDTVFKTSIYLKPSMSTKSKYNRVLTALKQATGVNSDNLLDFCGKWFGVCPIEDGDKIKLVTEAATGIVQPMALVDGKATDIIPKNTKVDINDIAYYDVTNHDSASLKEITTQFVVNKVKESVEYGTLPEKVQREIEAHRITLA